METIKDLKNIQEQHRKQLKENRDKTMARKKRAHRLIVRGAIAEKIVKNAENMTDEEFQKELYSMLNKASNAES